MKVVALSFQKCQGKLLCDLPRQLATHQNGNGLANLRKPDSPAVVEFGFRLESLPAQNAKLEDAGPFQKKFSLFPKEGGHTVKIDNLIIHFGLGKIGVRRKIQCQTRADPVFQILQTNVPRKFVWRSSPPLVVTRVLT